MATTVFKIPLTNIPQKFEIVLSDVTYVMKVRWFDGQQLWVFSLSDIDTEEILINDMPLVTGEDLLAQWAFLGIPGKFICFTAGSELLPPTLENLGVEANLFYTITE
ncbi:MAG: hypothetical protein KAS30_01510 [Candidatus Diapherotrites archaeon]|nr:hypothetical protein [Candidatus Diapherotrites archaeon]